MRQIRNTTTVRDEKAKALTIQGQTHSIANTLISVNATSTLAAQVGEELQTDMEELDMEDVINAQANSGNE